MASDFQSQKSTNPRMEDLKDKFVKHYAGIKLNCDAPFEERMQFDIYKRATKLNRYNVFIESQKQKQSKEEAERVFNRLYEDTQKRIEQKRKTSKPVTKEINQRKMTQAETNNLYNDFMEKWKKSQEALEEKRKVKKLKEEMEEAELLAIQKGTRKHRGKGSSLVERMNSDVKQRRLRQEERINEQKQKDKDELKQMFIPRTNNNYYRHLRKGKLNGSVCTNNHYKKDDTPKEWDKRQEWKSPDTIEDYNEQETVRCKNPELISGNFEYLRRQILTTSNDYNNRTNENIQHNGQPHFTKRHS